MKNYFLLFMLAVTFIIASCSKDSGLINSIETESVQSMSMQTDGIIDVPEDEISYLHFPGQPREFVSELVSLNGSGVTGTARIKVFGDQVSVKIKASGAVPNQVHPQHIHGMEDSTMPANCPTIADDTNGDGFVDLFEGLPQYGGVVLSLTDFPTANEDGEINYNKKLPYESLLPLGDLENRHFVLHGMMVNGEYDILMPIACGSIQRIK